MILLKFPLSLLQKQIKVKIFIVATNLGGMLEFALIFKESSMFNPTNYYEQSLRLPSEYKISSGNTTHTFKFVDAITFRRELCKIATATGLVCCAANYVFGYETALPIACTAVAGVSWTLFSIWAMPLESEAQSMILAMKGQKPIESAFFSSNKTFNANCHK